MRSFPAARTTDAIWSRRAGTKAATLKRRLAACDIIIEQDYSTLANQQAMMETFRASAQLDAYGRLTVISSTQVPFHVRRNVATALGIPKNQVRVIKPRIGGGFGAKQTMVCEVYSAIVTMKTGLPAMMVYTRGESQTTSARATQ